MWDKKTGIFIVTFIMHISPPIGGQFSHPRMIEANASRALAQYVQRDSSISTRTLATRLFLGGVDVSYS